MRRLRRTACSGSTSSLLCRHPAAIKVRAPAAARATPERLHQPAIPQAATAAQCSYRAAAASSGGRPEGGFLRLPTKHLPAKEGLKGGIAASRASLLSSGVAERGEKNSAAANQWPPAARAASRTADTPPVSARGAAEAAGSTFPIDAGATEASKPTGRGAASGEELSASPAAATRVRGGNNATSAEAGRGAATAAAWQTPALAKRAAAATAANPRKPVWQSAGRAHFDSSTAQSLVSHSNLRVVDTAAESSEIAARTPAASNTVATTTTTRALAAVPRPRTAIGKSAREVQHHSEQNLNLQQQSQQISQEEQQQQQHTQATEKSQQQDSQQSQVPQEHPEERQRAQHQEAERKPQLHSARQKMTLQGRPHALPDCQGEQQQTLPPHIQLQHERQPQEQHVPQRREHRQQQEQRELPPQLLALRRAYHLRQQQKMLAPTTPVLQQQQEPSYSEQLSPQDLTPPMQRTFPQEQWGLQEGQPLNSQEMVTQQRRLAEGAVPPCPFCAILLKDSEDAVARNKKELARLEEALIQWPGEEESGYVLAPAHLKKSARMCFGGLSIQTMLERADFPGANVLSVGLPEAQLEVRNQRQIPQRLCCGYVLQRLVPILADEAYWHDKLKCLALQYDKGGQVPASGERFKGHSSLRDKMLREQTPFLGASTIADGQTRQRLVIPALAGAKQCAICYIP
ncbi:AF4/FMR2 family member 4-like [Cyclospora cayetanensis]|uniref:AF4/FMR2 family member 4-like n=1 Tax=Cyclospora cayetanensis TaxID=88456 RepID=A0A6P6S4E2_9EIME|nr:AF4/FMR2 family member 4-like [Cyclospora cayetanensis]